MSLRSITIVAFIGAALVLVLVVALRLGDDPQETGDDVAAIADDEGVGEAVTPATTEPLDVDALGITLQIDNTRAPLAEVVALFRTRVEVNPSDHISHTTLAATLLAQARATGNLALYVEAEAVADEALLLAPESADARLTKAAAEAARHDFSAALARAEGVLADTPGHLGALAAIGDAQLELGDYVSAADTFSQLAAADRSATAVSRLARLEFLTGDTDASIAASIEALERAAVLPLRPTDGAFYWFQLGHHLFEAGDVTGAATALERALAVDPTHPGSVELLAHVRTAQGRLEDAIALYGSLLVGGGAADIHGELAIVLRLTGADAGADEQIRAGLDLAAVTIETFPAERRHIAGFLVVHDPPVALELAEQDLAIRQDVYAYDTLAWALLANDRPEEADEAMRSALAVETRDADLFYHAGVIAEAVGDDERARALLDEALTINSVFDPVDAPAAIALLEQLANGEA